jgi:hypothetical protein
MTNQLLKTASLCLIALSSGAGAATAKSSTHSVSLTQDPVVMRLSKDEFRIAFGLNGERCAQNGCNGVIHYRVEWKTEDGATHTDSKRVDYMVSPRAPRAMTVDRQYFDTAEGAHTTDVVKVSIERITCLDGTNSRGAQVASIATAAVGKSRP